MILTTFNFGFAQNSTTPKGNELWYGEMVYPVSKGLEEVFKKHPNHSASQLNITDGEFYQTQVSIMGNLNYIWRAKDASVWLYVKMYAPGSKGLTTGTYTIKPNKTDIDLPSLANTTFFKKGKIAIDLNKNGKLDKGVEYFKIIDGSINVEVEGVRYMTEFDVQLGNGENVKGRFKKNFVQV